MKAEAGRDGKALNDRSRLRSDRSQTRQDLQSLPDRRQARTAAMLDLVWDIQQHAQIQEANANAQVAKARADGVQTTLSLLTRRVDRLSLTCQAMWELLRDKHGVSEEELNAKLLEVDLRDGTTDGRMQMAVVDCPKCQAKTNTKRSTCVMCGAPLTKPHVFEV